MVLHGVRADPGPLGTGLWGPPHAAGGTGRVQPRRELSVCFTAAAHKPCWGGSALSAPGTSVWGEGGLVDFWQVRPVLEGM